MLKKSTRGWGVFYGGFRNDESDRVVLAVSQTARCG